MQAPMIDDESLHLNVMVAVDTAVLYGFLLPRACGVVPERQHLWRSLQYCHWQLNKLLRCRTPLLGSRSTSSLTCPCCGSRTSPICTMRHFTSRTKPGMPLLRYFLAPAALFSSLCPSRSTLDSCHVPLHAALKAPDWRMLAGT